MKRTFDPLALPFLLRLQALSEAAVPPTLERASRVVHAILSKHGRSPGRYNPARVSRHVAGMRTDRQLRQFLLERATIRDVGVVILCMAKVQAMAFENDVNSGRYIHLRRALGKRPTALRMVRYALSEFDWQA